MMIIYKHMFTVINRDGDKGFRAGRPVTAEASMFDGQTMAHEMARDKGCDVLHNVYNEYLYKWVYLGEWHADGTCTDSSGKRQRFTGDPVKPWEKID